MKRAGWAALVAVLCVAGAFLWWRSREEPAQLADNGELVRAPQAAAEIEQSAAVSRTTAPLPSQETQSRAQGPDYAAQLRVAPDYLEFVRSLLGVARAGDHAAQFYIFRALDYCDDGYRGYFGYPRVHRTLDDALKRQASRWPYETEEVRRVHARCHTLMESDAMDPVARFEWLRQASDGDYPLAQVLQAQEQWRATIGADDDDAAKADERRRLVALAIRSREPEVIWEVGGTPLEIGPEGAEVKSDYLSWYLAACLRGLDCSPQSETVRQMCRLDPRCQPFETVGDILRRGSENEFPELEARAHWINEKIDAGDWEALGF